MGQHCGVCTSVSRSQIEEAIIRGESCRKVSRQFPGVSKDQVSRHKAHITALMMQSAAARGIARGDEMAAQLQALTVEAQKLKRNAEREKDWKTALMGVREICRIAELICRLDGLTERSNVTVNVNVSASEGVSEAAELLLLLADRQSLLRIAGQLQARAEELEPVLLEGSSVGVGTQRATVSDSSAGA